MVIENRFSWHSAFTRFLASECEQSLSKNMMNRDSLISYHELTIDEKVKKDVKLVVGTK